MHQLTAWFKRTFSDPQVVILSLFLIVGLMVVLSLGAMLAPVFAALVIAYLLEGVVVRLEQLSIPRLLAVTIVFGIFLAVLVFIIFGLGPLLSNQIKQLAQQIPSYINQGQNYLRQLPENYPEYFNAQQIDEWVSQIGNQLEAQLEQLLNWSISSLIVVGRLLFFLVLIPILVFFFLKDKGALMTWVTGRLPRNRDLVTSIWTEVDDQIGNYIRGKVVEIVIVGAVAYVTFAFMGLQYAALLATVVGFSVLIPYIGAIVVTIPVALVAFFQFGWGSDFAMVVIAYTVIQALDGNLLVPLLFSGVVNLHPVAIIIAVLFFGGLWGFWGVFFAIPLATLVSAIISAWPKPADDNPAETEAPAS